jgi:phosphatidate cytidylyltransferase
VAADSGRRERRAEARRVLAARLATAAVAVPLLIWLVFWAPFVVYRGVVLLFTLVALVEYFQMASQTRLALQRLGIVSGALISLGMAAGNPPDSAMVFAAGLMAVVTIGLMSCLLAADDPAGAVNSLGHMVLGVLYAGAFLPHFIWLRVRPPDAGPCWVIFVLAVAMGGDSGGYFAGRFLGKRLLMPSVSPKKTIEGVGGAILGNLVAGAIVHLVCLPDVGWRETLLLSAVAGLLAQIGDLCESLLKRAFGAKDSGWLLPGHGGVLDRADSLVFPIVFVYYYVNFLRAAG